MATLPAASVGEVRLDLNREMGDGTDSNLTGYAHLFPNLAPGTRYRASNVDPQVAEPIVCPVVGGLLRDPSGVGYPKVLASDAAGITHEGLQWVLEFHLDDVAEQPADLYFTVPAGSFVNVGLLADPSPQPSVQQVVVASQPVLDAATQAEASADRAETAAAAAEIASGFTDATLLAVLDTPTGQSRTYLDSLYDPPFNFAELSPSYFVTFDQPDTTLVQAFVIHEKTGDIYTTQVANGYGSDATQSVRLSRLSPDGKLLSYMTLRYAGHGTLFHLEDVGSDVYVHTHWYRTVDTATGTGLTHGYARFRYQGTAAGLTWDHTNAGITWLNPQHADYVSIFGDQRNGLVGYRESPGTSEYVRVRTLANAKAGISTQVYPTLTIPTATVGTTMQGAALDGDTLYWLTGPPNGASILSEFHLPTGELVQQQTVSFGQEPNTGYDDSNYEPEGIFLYHNPLTGAKSLFVGMATGTSGARNPKAYAYHSSQNVPLFLGARLQRFDRLLHHEVEWKDLPLDADFSAIDAQSVPQYRRLAGRTELRGTVKHATSSGITSGMVCATLPSGYRPKTYQRLNGATSSTAETVRRINIGDNGAIELNWSGTGGITWQSLDNLSFEANWDLD